MDEVTGGTAASRDPGRGRAPDLRRAAAARRSSSTRRRSARRCTRGASRSRPATSPSCARRPRRERLLGVLLVPVSLVIIAVGLGVLWLSVRAERRASQLQERLHRQRLARAEDAAVADPHVRRAAGDRASTRARRWRASTRGIITRESERLSHLIDNVLDFARLERGKASYNFAEGRPRRGGRARAGRVPPPPGEGEAALAHRDRGRPAARAHGRGRDDAGAAEPGRQRRQVRGRRRRGVGQAAARAGRGGAVDRATAARASRPTSSGASSSASTAPRTRARATCAAAASGWRWSSTSPRRTAAASRWRARRGSGATFTRVRAGRADHRRRRPKSGWRRDRADDLAAASRGRRRILIIEDEPDLVRGLRDALEFEGFEVCLVGHWARGRAPAARARRPTWCCST